MGVFWYFIVMKLGRKFFERDTLSVAKDLLGKVICRKVGSGLIRGRIIETEAYIGEDDKACHARFGRTKRNEVMYDKAGHTYIYLCYGIHYMLNIVTEKKNFPSAVLIRRIKPLGKKQGKNNYGPGSLTKFLRIDKRLNSEDITRSSEIWVEDDGYIVDKNNIFQGARIGIDYAGDYIKKPWRFWIE